MGISQYPRLGYRLAPKCLQDILDVPIPRSQLTRNLAAGLKLSELDESSWTQFKNQTCRKLGRLIVRHICARVQSLPPSVLTRTLPAIPASLQLDDLELESRTRNCLQQMMSSAGLANLEELGKLTVGQILPTSGFGAKGLVDLLTSLEGITLFSPPPFLSKLGGACTNSSTIREDHLLKEEMDRLRAMPDSNSIRLDDPRLTRHLQPLFRYIASVSVVPQVSHQESVMDLVNRIAGLHFDSATGSILCGQLRTVRKQIILLSRLTLEKELRGIVLAVKRKRTANILLYYRGWDGSGLHTLKQAGAHFGITASAVKKKWAGFREQLVNRDPYLPILEKSLSFINFQCPAPTSEIESNLGEWGFTKRRFQVEGLMDAAELFASTSVPRIEVVARSRVIVSRDAEHFTCKTLRLASNAVKRQGIGHLRDIVAVLSRKTPCAINQEVVIKTLRLRKDFRWLGPRDAWFSLFDIHDNPLARLVRKILSVSSPIRLDVLLNAALLRLEPQAPALTRELLSDFCRNLCYCTVENEMVSSVEPIDPKSALCDSELRMLEVLKEKGPLLDWNSYRMLCEKTGVSGNTFSRTIRKSPIFSRYSKSQFGIIGLRPPD